MADDDIATEFEGTMIYGADGAVYVVPDDALSAYRLDDAAAEKFRGKRAELAGEVTGFGGASGPLDFPLALRGTFGRRNFYQGPVILHVEPLHIVAPDEP